LNKVGLGSVKGFYSGKVLLITGTTGFLGKLVLEKILRVLSDVKKIYLLTRPKVRKRR
jgi:alcohol-forming fatty acyl-CoA reductase